MTPRTMKVGISGGGPAGLTLAAILSREAGGEAFDITVFERGSRTRDQGSGWDMNLTAQGALKRAGVTANYQRQGSDTMRFFRAGKDTPDMCLRMPGFLSRWGIKREYVGLDEINLETERKVIIDSLIASLGSNVNVVHDLPVSGMQRAADGSMVELVGKKGTSFGKFDLVIDASGVASSLRHARFTKEADAFYTGQTFVQGVVTSPEASWDEEVVKRLGEGTYGVAGPDNSGQGVVELFAQRYGAEKEDQMANVTFKMINEKPGDAAEVLGLQGVHGITRDKDAVVKVVQHVKSQLTHPTWEEMHRKMFDGIDAVRVLPIFMHPLAKDTLACAVDGSAELPMIGIGDALHALPPWSGSSGNFALTDATELASVLIAEQKTQWTHASLARAMRESERKFLERADGPRERCIRVGEHEKIVSRTPLDKYDFFSHIIGDQSRWTMEATFVIGFINTLTMLNWWENYGY